MTPSITSKLPAARTTIFTTMSALAVEYKAVNLGQGFPDFAMNEELISLVNMAMKNGYNQYVHMNGLPLLRERIAEKIDYLYNAKINPDTDITVTPGATYGIYAALTSFVHPGDEVIYFEPAYDSYLPGIIMNGGIPVPVKLVHPDYTINWDEVKKAISEKTKAIIINTPHNPTGKILSENDIAALRAIVKDTNILIISDEVYEHIIFDEEKHLSLLRYPDLAARSFICFSFGKVYHCTGWKMGYVVAPASMMNEFRKVHQFNCFTCNSPVQHALAAFITQREHYLELGKQLQQKRDYFDSIMSATKFKPLPSKGSYFQLFDYAELSKETENEFAIRLTKEYGVTTIPVSAFYSQATDHQLLRFCFVKEKETLDRAVEKLLKM